MAEKRIVPEDLLVYARAGLSLIPLHKWDALDHRRPDKDGKPRPRGKTPRDTDWTTRPYVNEEVVAEAAQRGNNVGVRLPATVVVVDVDPRNFPDGRDVLTELDLEVDLELETAPHAVTGSGGHHYFFRKPADVDVLDSLADFPGIEFKSRGRQVVGAGSIHPCGAHYRWDASSPPLEEMPPLPARVVALVRRPVNQGLGNGAGEMTPEQLATCLELLDPSDFREHDRWRDLMMACHHATAGEARQEFIDWSTGDPQYADDAWIIGRRWDSLHLDRGGEGSRPITARFLHKVLKDAGHSAPNAAPEEDFEEVETDEELHVDGDRGVGEDPAPANMLDEMNARHCVVVEGGKFRVFTEMRDPVLNRQYYARSTKSDFEDTYSNRLVEVGDKLMPVGHWWLRQGQRRQYQGVLFDPERSHPGWLNLWKGWSVQPQRGDWGLMKDLLLEVLCDGDRACYEYVLNWSAYMVQFPSRPAEVAICFRGEKGTGKGTFGRALTGLAGSHGLHISSPGHLTGRFNSHLKDCIALFADEAFWAGDKAGESVLKQLVTEPTLVYEGKGQNAESGRNLIHIVMASNSDWVVPAGLDGERRFAVFEVNTRAQGDKERFKRIHAQMQSGGTEAMLFELLTRDLKDWAPRDDVPATRALMQQKLQSMDDVESWWFEKLRDGFLPNARGSWDAGDVVVVKEFLRKDYLDHAKQLGMRRMMTETQFGLRLGKLCPGMEGKQVRANEDEYGIKTDTHGRAMAYVVPSLAKARAAFEQKVAARMEW